MSRLVPRLAALLTALVLLSGGATAVAQDGGGSAFDPLPPPAPAETATPTPPPSVEAQQETDRRLLYGIGAALLVLFVVIGRFITRDARRTLGERAGAEAAQAREPLPAPRRPKQVRSKARAKGRAQRAARRHNR